MLRVTTTSDPEGWGRLVQGLPPGLCDVHQSLALHLAHEHGGVNRGVLLSLELHGQLILQPLLISGSVARHVHNFGGPVGSPGLADLFLREKHVYFRSCGVTEEHCTLNPYLLGNQLQLVQSCGPREVKRTVAAGSASLDLRPTTRHMVGRARDAGVEVSCAAPCSFNVELFHDCYSATMERRRAAGHWRHSREFFQNYLDCMAGNAALLLASVREIVEAGCILVHGNGRCYYHWAGSRMQHPRLGVSHLMVVEAAAWAVMAGCHTLHLGGGVTTDQRDGLFIFKSGFSAETLPVVQYAEETRHERAA